MSMTRAAGMECPITHIETPPDPPENMIALWLKDGSTIAIDERSFPL